MFPPPPPPEDERYEYEDRGHRPHRDDDFETRFRQPELPWVDRLFKTTPMVLLVLFSIFCSCVAMIFAIVGVASCKDPKAKSRASVVLIVSIIFIVLMGIYRSQMPPVPK